MQPCYRTWAQQNSRPWVLALAWSAIQGMKIPSTFEIETSGPRRQNEMIQTEPQCLDRNHLATAAGLALGKPRPQSSSGWAGPRIKHTASLSLSVPMLGCIQGNVSRVAIKLSRCLQRHTKQQRYYMLWNNLLYTMNMYYSRWQKRS